MATTEQPWKQKYFDSLEDFEQKEKHWSEVEDLLRRTISRLTLAADGLDDALDNQLVELRNAIRDRADSPALSRKIETMSKTLVRLDGQRAQQQEAAPPTQLLEQLLDQLSLPKGTGRKQKALKKELSKAGKDTAPEPVVRAFAELLSQSLQLAQPEDAASPGDEPASPAAKPAKEGMLKRLFAKEGTAPATTHPNIDPLAEARELLIHLADQITTTDAVSTSDLRQRVLRAEQARELRTLGGELIQQLHSVPADPTPTETEEAAPAETGMPVHEALLQLLEQLQLPAECATEIEALQDQLDHPGADTPWHEVLEGIAGLVNQQRARIQAEKQALEDFLKQLTERLQEVDEHLHGSEAFREASLQSSRELDAAVKEEVREIETSVRDAADLDQLKNEVQGHLENIIQQLEVHQRDEEQSHTQAKQEVATLQARLKQMEDETEQLRDRVREERAQAMTDALTGIPNRMAFDERMAQELARWKRFKTPLALLMWDVDHFKHVNDDYGHKAGDKVLKTIAKSLQAEIRVTDFLARFGGEEFVLLMTGTELPVIQEVADKLRGHVAESGFHFRGTDVQVTISCGIALFSNDDTPEQVFERADQALYRAKEQGRNRCVAAE